MAIDKIDNQFEIFLHLQELRSQFAKLSLDKPPFGVLL